MPISNNRTVAHGVLDKYLIVIKRGKAQANRKVALSVLTPISSKRTVAHSLLDKL